jgi:LEA14-like dessication related protein
MKIIQASKLWLVAFSTFSFLAGCHLQDVELINIKSVTYKDYSNMLLRLEIEAVINNLNSHAITLQHGELKLQFNGKEIGTVMQMEPVRLKAKKQESYSWQIAVRMDNFQDNLNALFRLLMNNTSELSLSGTVGVKMLLWRKTITINKQLQ